ncbi:MAG: type II toxin-antitoxin system VapC family toxin [Candidatus Limnocylindrales bacterium]
MDTAVLMYAAGDAHELREPSARIVRLVRDGQLDAVISAEVIQEILHRFVAIRRPDIGSRMARDALDLFAPVLPITHGVMDRMPALVDQYPALAARDLVHVATCIENGIGVIVSPDRGLDAVSEVTRVPVEDIETLVAR